MSDTLMQASHQWAHRPSDERYLSLTAMLAHFERQRLSSTARVVRSAKLLAVPDDDNKGLVVQSPDLGVSLAPTHWSFGQLAGLAGAPAAYLRTLASPISADCLNYGLRFNREVEEVGVLMYQNGGPAELRAATGPKYGRIWNEQVLRALVDRFGDGRTGDFRVPGEFGQQVEVTKANTTLYAGDRDMFVFLADETHRIEIADRRDGKPGSFARGFFVWNSEVGKTAFGVSTFLFDYVCCNRIVWGARDYAEVILRHTASAPDKFVDEITPALHRYAESSTASVTTAIEDARKSKVDDVDAFLAGRYGKRMASTLSEIHVAEEGRPIETRWDVVTAVTAFARSIEHQDRRVELERNAGELLNA